jgi:hypothetical protein
VPDVRKISVSMHPQVLEQVKLAAAATGESVSGWLTSAAVRLLEEQSRLEIGRIAARELVAEYEAEHGPIPPGITDDVRRYLADQAREAG